MHTVHKHKPQPWQASPRTHSSTSSAAVGPRQAPTSASGTQHAASRQTPSKRLPSKHTRGSEAGACRGAGAACLHEHSCRGCSWCITHSFAAKCPSRRDGLSISRPRSTSEGIAQQPVGLFPPNKVSSTLRDEGSRPSAVSATIARTRRSDSFIEITRHTFWPTPVRLTRKCYTNSGV